MHLRTANLADVELLRRWDTAPHVLESDPNDEWDYEADIAPQVEWRESFIAEHEGRPIGFVQILDPARDEERYWGESPPNLRAIDIWIGEASDLNRGLGTLMMKLALDRCFAAPNVEAVLLDPLFGNLRARRFYERFGFRFIERRTFGEDDCAVYRLERERWERDRAERAPLSS